MQEVEVEVDLVLLRLVMVAMVAVAVADLVVELKEPEVLTVDPMVLVRLVVPAAQIQAAVAVVAALLEVIKAEVTGVLVL
jgi:hypothetical protein